MSLSKPLGQNLFRPDVSSSLITNFFIGDSGVMGMKGPREIQATSLLLTGNVKVAVALPLSHHWQGERKTGIFHFIHEIPGPSLIPSRFSDPNTNSS